MEAVLPIDPSVRTSLAFLQEVLGNQHLGEVAVRLWDGTVWKNTPRPRCTLVLKHPGALRRMFWPTNQLALGEAYIYDDFDIEGEIEEGFTLADALADMPWGVGEKLQFARHLWSLPAQGRTDFHQRGRRPSGRLHSRRRDAEAIRFHYDLSNDFFRLWLDPNMVYSCGYFAAPQDGLEAAQERKLDYICRKLRLRPGERLLDIGCGWGGLIRHAVRHYGVEAHGITISPAQAELAAERIREDGLGERCRVEVRDYRELQLPHCYDKVVSIGMFEHVGADRITDYFAQTWRLLRPGGVFLNHGIASTLAQPLPGGPSFIDRYVFPDGELVSLTDTLRVAEMTGFEIRDVESLREHYTLTLRQWVQRLEQRRQEVIRTAGEAVYRIWRLYMAGSAHNF
ncbi:MAG: class I SAM-dependent methyltransferase, partial [Desulfuromonadales bacterium]|nr:class I SAM-dependent methyltransferase [Desulfuromonadales bacterium]